MPEHWYALKIFYNRVFEMEDLLEASGYQTFLAADKLLLKGMAHLMARKRIAKLQADHKPCNQYIQEGAQIFQRVPMVTSLLFVRAAKEDLSQIDKLLVDRAGERTGFIYKTADREHYSAIPDSQMEAFRLVTAKGSEGLEFFSADDITRFKEGNRVRVKEGPLRGAEGYIKRIKRERRLLVSIQGVVAVATTYIPPEMLEIVVE